MNIKTPVSFKVFKKNAQINITYKSKESKYYNFHFDDEEFNFCISNHLSKHRKKFITIISKQQDINTATKIAYEIYTERLRVINEELFKPK